MIVKRVFREKGVNLELPMTIHGTSFQHILHVILAGFLCQGKGIDDVSCCIEECVSFGEKPHNGANSLQSSQEVVSSIFAESQSVQ